MTNQANNSFLDVIEYICIKLINTRILWALTGSLNHAMQGVNIKPNDIDIISDKSGIYAIEKIFRQYIAKPVCYSEQSSLRSHYGMLRISNISVDLMSDVENLLKSGIWDSHVGWQDNIQQIKFRNSIVPVLSLGYELATYRKLGLWKRADLISNKLAENQVE